MKKIERQIEQYLDYCANERKLVPLTVQYRRVFFKNFLQEVPARSIEQISNLMVSNWIKSHPDWMGSTANVYIVEVKTMLRYFKRQGVRLHIDLDQITRVKEEQRRKVFYTRQQIAKVLDECNDLEWLLISLCFDCGFRIHELAELRLSNIDGRKVVFIGKGRKLRETYMSKETHRKLEVWIQEQHIDDHLWVQRYKNGSEKPMTKETLGHLMKAAFIRAGFDNFHPHALRHSFATDIRDNGAPIDVIRDMLGHADIQTTIRYVHSLDGQLEKSFEKYRFTTA